MRLIRVQHRSGILQLRRTDVRGLQQRVFIPGRLKIEVTRQDAMRRV